jgi:hypothetical protein
VTVVKYFITQQCFSQEAPEVNSLRRLKQSEVEADERSKKSVVCLFITPYKKMSEKPPTFDAANKNPSSSATKQVLAPLQLFSRPAADLPPGTDVTGVRLSSVDLSEDNASPTFDSKHFDWSKVDATNLAESVSSKPDIVQPQPFDHGLQAINTSVNNGRSLSAVSCANDELLLHNSPLISDVILQQRREATQRQLDRIAARKGVQPSEVTMSAGNYWTTRQQADKRRRISLKQAVDGLRPVRCSVREVCTCFLYNFVNFLSCFRLVGNNSELCRESHRSAWMFASFSGCSIKLLLSSFFEIS